MNYHNRNADFKKTEISSQKVLLEKGDAKVKFSTGNVEVLDVLQMSRDPDFSLAYDVRPVMTHAFVRTHTRGLNAQPLLAKTFSPAAYAHHMSKADIMTLHNMFSTPDFTTRIIYAIFKRVEKVRVGVKRVTAADVADVVESMSSSNHTPYGRAVFAAMVSHVLEPFGVKLDSFETFAIVDAPDLHASIDFERIQLSMLRARLEAVLGNFAQSVSAFKVPTGVDIYISAYMPEISAIFTKCAAELDLALKVTDLSQDVLTAVRLAVTKNHRGVDLEYLDVVNDPNILNMSQNLHMVKFALERSVDPTSAFINRSFVLKNYIAEFNRLLSSMQDIRTVSVHELAAYYSVRGYEHAVEVSVRYPAAANAPVVTFIPDVIYSRFSRGIVRENETAYVARMGLFAGMTAALNKAAESCDNAFAAIVSDWSRQANPTGVATELTVWSPYDIDFGDVALAIAASKNQLTVYQRHDASDAITYKFGVVINVDHLREGYVIPAIQVGTLNYDHVEAIFLQQHDQEALKTWYPDKYDSLPDEVTKSLVLHSAETRFAPLSGNIVVQTAVPVNGSEIHISEPVGILPDVLNDTIRNAKLYIPVSAEAAVRRFITSLDRLVNMRIFLPDSESSAVLREIAVLNAATAFSEVISANSLAKDRLVELIIRVAQSGKLPVSHTRARSLVRDGKILGSLLIPIVVNTIVLFLKGEDKSLYEYRLKDSILSLLSSNASRLRIYESIREVALKLER